MIYVISDIHGELEKLNKMLELINFSEEDTLYILGDMIDRGKFPITTLIKCINSKNIIPLMGNHEKMMIEYLDDSRDDNWLRNGGRITLNQFSEMSKDNRETLKAQIINFPFYKVVNINNTKFVLVHAGMTTYDNGDISEVQTEDFMIWAREDFYRGRYVNDKQIIIFGHNPVKTIHGKWEIWHGENKICIDCGAAYGGKLACLRLDDMKEFYI